MTKSCLMFLLLCAIYATNIFTLQSQNKTAQNNSATSVSSIDDLLTPTQWNSLFPKRAGTYGIHPQGYTTDFYSFANFKQAALELSDYLVIIRKKPGIWGELITITRKSTNYTYNYSDVDSFWYSNASPEVVITVDFEDFLNAASALNNKRELAAFLANISKETTGGWQAVGSGLNGDYAQWGLYFVYEILASTFDCSNPGDPQRYRDESNTTYPPSAGKCYYGRGPIQLSWNYNYGQFSKFLYENPAVLLDNPDAIQQNGVLAFKSAIWFWMMPQWPKPSCHQVMQDLWIPQTGEYTAPKMYKKGFAHTNNIINGGLECRNMSSTAYTQKVVIRSNLYKYYLGILGFTTTQIQQEDEGDYSTLCFESSSNAMQDYLSGYVLTTTGFGNEHFTLYPNPTFGIINITLSNNQPIIKISINNLLGQTIMTFENTTTLDISSLTKGTYFVKMVTDSGKETQKIIKL